MLQSWQTNKRPRSRLLFWLLVIGIISFLTTIISEYICFAQIFSVATSWNSPFLVIAETPIFIQQYQYFLPTIILSLFALAITRISPQPKTWSRSIVVAILLALLLRYLLWRSLLTLNLASPFDAFFSLGLFLVELFLIIRNLVSLFLMLRVSDHSQKAEEYSKNTSYLPSVDILIPSYNEPEFILRRTIIGCQAINYTAKSVYLLDDTNRPHIAKLAQELGCEYFTRPDNRYAKAGNLNHALLKTDGDLIVVFDADFIPTTNFLTRTVGFFQNPDSGLVQTPQTFYNPDPITYNLGLETIFPPEEEIFYRQVQAIKDANGSTVCAGTSFIVRRKALAEVGYFVTDSISEDYFTGIQLSAKGYKIIYLNEKLSAGLAAETIIDHVQQRLRWARGTLQAFFITSNPLTIPGLNIRQRLTHLEGILHWFDNFPRLLFMVLPLPCLLFNLSPVLTSINDLVYTFLPFYILNNLVFAWLNLRSRSVFFSDVYELVSLFPLTVTVLQAISSPFSKGFKVTPKGISRNKSYYNWQLSLPLFILLLINVLALVAYFYLQPNSSGLSLIVYWSIYNIFNIGLALCVLLERPKPNQEVWLEIEEKVLYTFNETTLSAKLSRLSETGAEITLENKQLVIGNEIKLEMVGRDLELKCLITEKTTTSIRVSFIEVTIQQERRIIETLFCRPGQWKSCQTPGELKSLGILLMAVWGFMKRLTGLRTLPTVRGK